MGVQSAVGDEEIKHQDSLKGGDKPEKDESSKARKEGQTQPQEVNDAHEETQPQKEMLNQNEIERDLKSKVKHLYRRGCEWMARHKAQIHIVSAIILILVIILVVLFFVTLEKIQMEISIDKGKIEKTTIETKKISLYRLISPKEASIGINRIYLEIRDKNTNEIILFESMENVGGGNFIFSLPKVERGTWITHIESKKFENNKLFDLDKKCYEVTFAFGLKGEQKEIVCK